MGRLAHGLQRPGSGPARGLAAAGHHRARLALRRGGPGVMLALSVLSLIEPSIIHNQRGAEAIE